MRTFVIGDIHGACRALVQCLKRSGFDAETDRLISLGDVSDGWPETFQTVETLLQLPRHIAIAGNHDLWTRDWLTHAAQAPGWVAQGGQATLDSYAVASAGRLDAHRAFFGSQLPYFTDEGGRLFTHGGINPLYKLEEHTVTDCAWNRKFIASVMQLHVAGQPIPYYGYTAIYLGHTPLPLYKLGDKPLQMGTVWAMDTGAKAGFPLSILEVETGNFWQSDPVALLYPGQAGASSWHKSQMR
jgi:serine/threonine protein phosphatase 1